TDLGGAVPLDQVVVLLVGQRLDGGGVEALEALLQGQVDGELADDRLARPGGRRHQHAVARLKRPAGVDLELVELELVMAPERPESAPIPRVFLKEGRVAFRWGRHSRQPTETAVPVGPLVIVPGRRLYKVRFSRARSAPRAAPRR